jgi:DNA-binding MarR family transcriptional regulator
MPSEAGSLSSTPVPPKLRLHLGFLLTKSRQHLAEELDSALPADGPSLRHFAVLSTLEWRAGLRQTDVGDVLGLDRTTTMKVVDDLESRGMLHRTRRTEDRRAYTLEITDAGRAWKESVLPLILAQEERFLSPLSPGERVLLQEMLLRLVENSLHRKQDVTASPDV